MFDWPQQALTLIDRNVHCVAITIAAVRGSAPREAGSKLLVTADAQWGSIGGGYLEHECVRLARAALTSGSDRTLTRFALGSQCGQCCGGAVQVLLSQLGVADRDWLSAIIERQHAGLLSTLATPLDDIAIKITWTPTDTRADASIEHTHGQRVLQECIGPAPLKLTIFGAGHVGRAMAGVFATLDAQTIVVDNRQAQLDTAWPDNCVPLFVTDPERFVAHGTPDQHYLVMTHDHDLDFRLCSALMARGDSAFIGLIGSETKRRRFDKRWRSAGLNEANIATVHCPIGTPGITGKHPGEIAIAVAADILMRRQTAGQARTPLTLIQGHDA